jgi:hypothetical protein
MALQAIGASPMIEWYACGLLVKPTWKGQSKLSQNVKLNAAVRMGRAAVRARMKGRACQGLGRRGSTCSPLVERSV